MILLLLLRKETRETRETREERERVRSLFFARDRLQQRERAKKSPEKLAKLLNKTYDIYLNRERERERNFFLFLFSSTNRPTKSMNLRIPLPEIFEVRMLFLGPRSVSRRGGISPRGKKREKRRKTERTNTKKKRTRESKFYSAL
jgi:hypothetical protein